MGKMAVNMEHDARKLDTAKEATIDLVALNNMVVNMRSVVKAARVQVIHKLSRMIQKLKTKKGTEQQKEKNLRKAQRMLDEVFAMKELNPDSVTKFALANKTTYEDICKQPSASVEARSLLRLSEHRFLADKVKGFREAHTDWEELAAYLTTKQTGRRFRTKEQKLRAAKKGSKFVCQLDQMAGQGDTSSPKPVLASRQNADGGQTGSGVKEKQGSRQTEDSRQGSEESRSKHKEGAKTDQEDKGEELEGESSDSDQENVNCDESDSEDDSGNPDSGHDDDDVYTPDSEGDADSLSSSKNHSADVNENSDDDDVSKSDSDSDNESAEADSDNEDNSDNESEDDGEHDSDGEDDVEHDSDSEDDAEHDSDSENDAVNTHIERDSDESDRQSSDDEEDSDSSSKAVSLLTKAPNTSALMEDPFFMGDQTADSGQSHHWIEKDTVEKIDNIPHHRGGYSRAGRGQRPDRGSQTWPRPDRNEDSRWLKGDIDQSERGRGRGWGHRDHQRGRGAFSGRGGRGFSRGHRDQGPYRGGRGQGPSRGRRDQGPSRGHRDQGPSRGRRDQSSRGHEKGWRNNSSSSGAFRGQDHKNKFSGQGHQDKPHHQQAFKKKEKGAEQSSSKQEDPSSHPSWDASRKRKQMEQTATFSGKHIKFDDD